MYLQNIGIQYGNQFKKRLPESKYYSALAGTFTR